jgi:hypothetical protein
MEGKSKDKGSKNYCKRVLKAKAGSLSFKTRISPDNSLSPGNWFTSVHYFLKNGFNVTS